ncbi:MAG TPA: thiamine phosphate synthase [Methanoregula sp.]|nr:thiamine phosphate synthase [Methanoregula sp.]
MKLDLYVITDEAVSGGRSHAEIARLALAGGADAVQLRDKGLGCRNLVRIAREIAVLTRRHRALFIVNDRLDVALSCGADGVHLGKGDLRADTARQIAPCGFIIGVSVGSAGEAEEAEQAGADYVAVSPVFATGSKAGAGPGLGLGTIRAVRGRVSVPVIAIGGIGSANVESVVAAGADGIAVISAVAGAPDIEGAARKMKSLIAREKGRNRRGKWESRPP